MNHDDAASATVKTPWFTLRAYGTVAVIMLLELACTALILAYIWNQDVRAESRNEKNTQSVTAHLKEQNDLLEANLFMLSLKPEDRSKYRLDLPRALRDRVTRDR